MKNLERYGIIEDYKGLIEKLVIAEKLGKILVLGKPVVAGSGRYKNFYTHGYECCKCGAKVQFAAVEKPKEAKVYHINLYGLKDDGTEILFTKDHIYPRSRGGFDNVVNYQVMCERCNNKKKDKTNLTQEEAIELGYTNQERVDAYNEMLREKERFMRIQEYLKQQQIKMTKACEKFKMLVPKKQNLYS